MNGAEASHRCTCAHCPVHGVAIQQLEARATEGSPNAKSVEDPLYLLAVTSLERSRLASEEGGLVPHLLSALDSDASRGFNPSENAVVDGSFVASAAPEPSRRVPSKAEARKGRAPACGDDLVGDAGDEGAAAEVEKGTYGNGDYGASTRTTTRRTSGRKRKAPAASDADPAPAANGAAVAGADVVEVDANPSFAREAATAAAGHHDDEDDDDEGRPPEPQPALSPRLEAFSGWDWWSEGMMGGHSPRWNISPSPMGMSWVLPPSIDPVALHQIQQQQLQMQAAAAAAAAATAEPQHVHHVVGTPRGRGGCRVGGGSGIGMLGGISPLAGAHLWPPVGSSSASEAAEAAVATAEVVAAAAAAAADSRRAASNMHTVLPMRLRKTEGVEEKAYPSSSMPASAAAPPAAQGGAAAAAA
ncbi:unnamed protein product, partial [Phaeothamnion confervicola]